MSLLTAAILALLTFGLRLVEHPENVAPTAAAMLFAGAVLPRRWGWAAPLAGSVAADAVIGFYTWQVMLTVYASFVAVWALSALLNRAARPARTAVLATAGALLFFLATNWATWMWTDLYPATWAGLATSYAMGVPFFRNTLLGDLFFAGALFSAYAGALWTVRHRAELFAHRVMLRARDR